MSRSCPGRPIAYRQMAGTLSIGMGHLNRRQRCVSDVGAQHAVPLQVAYVSAGHMVHIVWQVRRIVIPWISVRPRNASPQRNRFDPPDTL